MNSLTLTDQQQRHTRIVGGFGVDGVLDSSDNQIDNPKAPRVPVQSDSKRRSSHDNDVTKQVKQEQAPITSSVEGSCEGC